MTTSGKIHLSDFERIDERLARIKGSVDVFLRAHQDDFDDATTYALEAIGQAILDTGYRLAELAQALDDSGALAPAAPAAPALPLSEAA